MTASSKLLINEHPLQTLPSLAKAIGLDKSVILQQIQYWVSTSPHDINGHKWIYNSYTEWSEQFPWLTAEGVRYHIRGLEKAGLIVAGKFNKDTRDKTKWYRINYTKLNKVLKTTDGKLKTTPADDKKLRLQPMKNYAPLPETTTKTTSEITTDNEGQSPSTSKEFKGTTEVAEVIREMQSYYGYPDEQEVDPIPNYGMEGKAVKTMLRRGFSVEEIVSAWKGKVKKAGAFKSMVFVNMDMKVTPKADKYNNQKYGHMFQR